MQPPVHAQPRVRVIVIDVKCYNIIQPRHVKCKQNGRLAKYCAFVWENTERRKPKNRIKSRKAFQADDSIDTSTADVFLLLLTRQLFQCSPSLLRVWSKSRSQSLLQETCQGWSDRELRNRRLSECEFVSCSCRRLCLHSLQLEDMPQFLATLAFFLCIILAGAGSSRLPTIQTTGGFLSAPKLFRAFWFLPPF